ncbi:MAG: M24 family metallopeptidase [Myxococcales bacterium]
MSARPAGPWLAAVALALAAASLAPAAAQPVAPGAPPAPPPSAAVPPPVPTGLGAERLAQIQAALQAAKIDGWLFYDFRRSDPIAARILGLDGATGPRTRRWYCLIPAKGPPRKLVHAIEPHALDLVPGPATTYAAWRVRDRELARLLQGLRRVAMDYSPRNDLPTVANVDAGTVELVRAQGPEVVSSADLVAQLGSTLSAAELASQARAAALLAGDLEAAAQEAVRRIRAGSPASERELQDFVLARWGQEGLDADGGRPGIAVDAHAADPHYAAPESGSALAGPSSLLLMDFAARLGPGAIYADLTRVYYLGDRTPSEVERIAEVVFRARDAALDLVQKRVRAGVPITGAEVDDEARRVITAAGFGDRFIHRTGHNLGLRVYGDGVHNDNFETHDVRRHLPDTCFSLEPGIYLPGRFGIRSEIDVCLLRGGAVELRPGDRQTSVPALLP